MRILNAIAAGLGISLLATISPSTASDETIEGHWLTEGGNVIVDIHACNIEADKVCGDIVWTEEPAKNAHLKDKQVLRNLTYKKGAWRSGKLWDAAAGKTYHANVSVKPDGRLMVNACALGRCYEQTWVRPNAQSASLEGYFAGRVDDER